MTEVIPMIGKLFDDPKFDDESEEDLNNYDADADVDVDEDCFCCNKCKTPFKREGDIFPYEEFELCEVCYDKQMRLDEMEVQEWEYDDTRDY